MARNSFYEGTVADAELIANASEDARLAEEKAAAAAASATSAAASYDSFDDRYLGTKSSDPSVDNDSATLVDGALYFNTSNNVMMVYDLGNTSWVRTTPTTTEQGHINTVSGISANVTTVAGISSDVTATAGKATEIGRLGTTAAVEDMSILGTAAIVEDMAILGTAAIVEDMSILATPAIVTDMSILGTAAVVEDMSILGTADIVEDLSILGTAAIVTDMSILGTAAVVEDLSILATSDIVEDLSILATSDIVTDMSILATPAIVTDMSILATADIVEDMSILGTAAIVEDMSILGTSANVTAMDTVATNIAGVNSFADRYRVVGSVPTSSLDEGDLYFNTTDNKLYHYNGSAWVENKSYSVQDGELSQVSFTTADNTKLDNIENGATADQSNAEIKTAYEANSDTNEFSDTEQSKLAGIEDNATADQTAAQIKTHLENGIDSVHYVDGSIDSVHIQNDVVLGGNPTTTTQSISNNTTRVATTAYVDAQVATVVDSAPGTLNTLNELAAALGDDENYATTTTASIATKLPKAGGEMSGNITMAGSQTVDGRDLSVDGAKLDLIAASANAYVHPTSAGNVHIPSGGSAGQILRYASAGTAAWGTDENDAVAMAIALG